MQLVPEWAPNIHPMFVHFPLALLFTAVFIDFFALLARPWKWLRTVAATLYTVGAVSAIVTYFTGQRAADLVSPPPEAQPLLTEHADLALWTIWFFGLYAVVRLAVLAFDKKDRLVGHLALFVVAAVGLYLPWQTGEHGSQMVYEHGVGVQAASSENTSAELTEQETTTADSLNAGPTIAENGSWKWTPEQVTAASLQSAFTWLEGEAASLQPEMTERSNQGEMLSLHFQGAPVLFVVDQPLASLQADATFDLGDFDGVAMLVHHVLDTQNYDFLTVEGNTMHLGRVRAGEETIFDEAPFETTDGLSIRAVADQDHFRGYVGEELVVHGHGEAAEPGPVGLRFEGTGTVRIARMEIQSLRE